jgi:hypothetical protein
MWWNTPAARPARDPAQPAALLPHHPRHRHRRVGGDHHGDAGQRRHPGGVRPDFQPGQQPADGAARPAHGPGRTAPGRRASSSPTPRPSSADRSAERGGARGEPRRDGGGYANRNWATSITGSTAAWLRTGNWTLATAASSATARSGPARRVRHRRNGAPRAVRHPEPGRRQHPRQAVLLRHHRPAGLQGPVGDGHGPGRRGADAAAHRAAAADRQSGRQQPDGVGEGRRVQWTQVTAQSEGADARAAQAGRKRGGQFQRAGHQADRRNAVRHHQGDDDAAGRGGGGEPAGRRHRHHEHHAGVGDRAHARDRHPAGHRRAGARGAAAVPDRGGGAVVAGRGGGHRAGDRRPRWPWRRRWRCLTCSICRSTCCPLLFRRRSA